MTTPQGPSGLNPDAKWGVTANDGSISGLPGRTQDNVTAALKGQVQQSSSWQGSTASVWGGLRRGSSGNPVGLPLAILEFFGRTLLGNGTWNALNQLNTDVAAFFSGKWTALTNIGNDILTLINEVGGQVITDVSNAINEAKQKADAAADNFATMLDGLLGTGHGITDFVNWLQARRDETQATWDAFWQGIFGGSATGKNTIDFKSAAAALTSIANTAKTNSDSALLQLATLIDQVLGGGHGVQDLAQYIINTWDGLVDGWNNLWDGIFGTSGSTGKTASDVKTAAQSVTSTANTASTNATTATSGVNAIVTGSGKTTPTATGNFISDTWNNLVNGWNNFWDGIFGTSGTTGKTAADVKTAAASVTSTANTANTNAGAATAGVNAIVSGAGKTSPTSTGNFISDTWNGLVAGWNNLWDGIFGTSGSTGKTAGDVKTAAASVTSTANTAKVNADTAITNNQSLTDAVTTGATGNESAQNTPADTADAVAALRTSVAEVRAALDDLQNDQTAPDGGVRFATSNNGWNDGTGLWTVTGTGTPAFTANHAYTMVKQTGSRYIYAVYATPLSSDQQTVTLTFSSSAENPNGFSDSSQYGGSNLVILRAAADLSTFVFARVWKNRIQFGYCAGGTLTMVGSPVALPSDMGPGVSVVVRCPNESNPYYFEARISGSLVASCTFTAAQAPYGANYRRIGQGMTIGVGIVGDLFMPGQIQQVSAADMNVGPGFIKGGIGAVMRRYNDAAFNQQAQYVSTVPESYFEVLEAVSPGVTKLTGGGAAGFVVQDAGLYVAEAGFYIPNGANYYGATFYSGPVGQSGTIHSYNSYYTWFARGMAVIVANDGDVIKPAASNSSTAVANMTGTTDGRSAFFSIARVG